MIKKILLDLLKIFGGLAALAGYVYLWTLFWVYTFHHWFVQTTDGSWQCDPTSKIARHTKYVLCHPYWYKGFGNFHWGLVLGIIISIAFTAIVMAVISNNTD